MKHQLIITKPVRKIKQAAENNLERVLCAMPLAGLRVKHRHTSIDSLLGGLPRPMLASIYRNLTS